MNARQIVEGLYVDKGVAIPLHYQIQVALENCVKSGRLKPGDRLPTVSDLSAMLDVSLHTALKAVTELQRRGVLISRRGTGTIVAPTRQGATDIILPSRTSPDIDVEHWDFHHQLFEGALEGFHDPERHIGMMYMGGRVCSPGEFLASMHARRVDSLIAYRPVVEHIPLLTTTAREMPVVSLFKTIPASPVHCVTADVEPAIRHMLEKRLKVGRKNFAYVAFNPDSQEGASSENISPYRIIYRIFQETLSDAGLDHTEHQINPYLYKEHEAGNVKLRGPNGRPLAPDTVIVLEYPRLANYLSDSFSDADIISYTEFRQTVSMLGEKLSLIYFGLDQAARAAVELIKERVMPGIGESGRVVRSKPKVFDLIDVDEGATAE